MKVRNPVLITHGKNCFITVVILGQLPDCIKIISIHQLIRGRATKSDVRNGVIVCKLTVLHDTKLKNIVK